MGDFAEDTQLEGGDGRYRIRLAPDWQNPMGPHGGYLSAVALRAAGTAAPHRRPVSYGCQFLGVAREDSLDVHVEILRSGRQATAARVTLAERERKILSAQVWLLDEGEGLEHQEAPMPDVPEPESLPSLEELLQGETGLGPPRSLYVNWDHHPIPTGDPAAPAGNPPIMRAWIRYKPRATFADPILDAARPIIPIDSLIFPAATRPHAPTPGHSPFGAQSLDLNVHFHAFAPEQEWLLCESTAPASGRGVVGGYVRVWARNGVLVASGTSQMVWRRFELPE